MLEGKTTITSSICLAVEAVMACNCLIAMPNPIVRQLGPLEMLPDTSLVEPPSQDFCRPQGHSLTPSNHILNIRKAELDLRVVGKHCHLCTYCDGHVHVFVHS